MTQTSTALADPVPETTGAPLLARVREATALLAQVAADRTVLDAVPADDRARLHAVVAQVYHPDPRARRQRDAARAHPLHLRGDLRREGRAVLEAAGGLPRHAHRLRAVVRPVGAPRRRRRARSSAPDQQIRDSVSLALERIAGSADHELRLQRG